jgi:alkanesulfonate monooxygenase SsuD/methylene tetrahydromethanopterin reductase-like flavin-dependent oxidoreductase (luciferase family)
MIELGIFTFADIAGPASPRARIRDIVDYGAYADEVGLDVLGIGEHHTPRFAVSSSAVVLAAVAARTSTIILSSAVSVLSVLDPVRLYQDFAQLDLVAGGRAEITAGRSAYAEPFEIFGVPLENYDAVFDEKLDLLLKLRTGNPVTWTGNFRPPLHDATITPRTGRALPVRLGVGGTAASAARAARLGLPMTLALLLGSPQQAKPVADMTSPHGALMVGSPQEIIDKIMLEHELLHLDRFMDQIDLGGLRRADALRSIELFAAEVAPVLRRELT